MFFRTPKGDIINAAHVAVLQVRKREFPRDSFDLVAVFSFESSGAAKASPKKNALEMHGLVESDIAVSIVVTVEIDATGGL